jgi:tetratricopeptide (TPR) repeat protein
MNSGRLDQLLRFLEEDPGDAFTLYAVALEYQKTDLAEAEIWFEKLLTNHPEYLPTYYMTASLKLEMRKASEAKAILIKGIKLAHENQDNSTLQELQSLYNSI